MKNEIRNSVIFGFILATALDEMLLLFLILLAVIVFETVLIILEHTAKRYLNNVDKEIEALKKIKDNSKKPS